MISADGSIVGELLMRSHSLRLNDKKASEL
jgi:hypothetical protein